MMPSVLRVTGRDIDRNGVMVTPRGVVSSCEHLECTAPAPFGDKRGGKYLTWCSEHQPKGPIDMGQREAS